MTDPEKRIEALVNTVPKIQHTRRQHALRVGAVIFALIASVALVLSVVNMYGVARVAACTNSNLGTRSAPTANDAKAHIAFAKAIEGLFLPSTATLADRRAAAEVFKDATRAYVHQLEVDQAARAAHPLGKC